MKIEQQLFGKTGAGEEVHLFTLQSSKGLVARITNLGGIITSLLLPDRDGQLADVVLGYDKLEQYLADPCYFGCLVGRYANRIGGGKMQIDGQEYQLEVNNDLNHLHGGSNGFNRRVWQAETAQTGEAMLLKLSLHSPDGDQGYPGNLQATCVYTLTEDNRLVLDYQATTDKTTVVNFTNHTYFNLAGNLTSEISDHELQIGAQFYTPLSGSFIPTGELQDVKGSVFDFRSPVKIGDRMGSSDRQSQMAGGGFDHNFLVNSERKGAGMAAMVYHPGSGRELQVATTQPGMQFYTPDFVVPVTGKQGQTYQGRCAFCLETQHYPDSPNQPDFPTTLLRPGETYKEQTVWRFGSR